MQGVLGDASNREPPLSPTRRKRKTTEVRGNAIYQTLILSLSYYLFKSLALKAKDFTASLGLQQRRLYPAAHIQHMHARLGRAKGVATPEHVLKLTRNVRGQMQLPAVVGMCMCSLHLD